MDFQGYIYSLDTDDLSKYSFEKYWDDYVLEKEYGFQPQFADTNDAIKNKCFHDWIVPSLIVKRNATLIRKSNNEIQKMVIFRRIDMKDGH